MKMIKAMKKTIAAIIPPRAATPQLKSIEFEFGNKSTKMDVVVFCKCGVYSQVFGGR